MIAIARTAVLLLLVVPSAWAQSPQDLINRQHRQWGDVQRDLQQEHQQRQFYRQQQEQLQELSRQQQEILRQQEELLNEQRRQQFSAPSQRGCQYWSPSRGCLDAPYLLLGPRQD